MGLGYKKPEQDSYAVREVDLEDSDLKSELYTGQHGAEPSRVQRIANAFRGYEILIGMCLCVIVSVVITLSTVIPLNSNNAPDNTVIREYWVSADEIEWDYAPTGINVITNSSFDASAQVYTEATATTIGRKSKKIIYREYYPGGFAYLKPVESWNGLLGPILRANVGEKIRVYFRNAASGRHAYSIHPHGVFYTKAHEGASYGDKTCSNMWKDGIVNAGDVYVYEWEVPERAGPGPEDPSTVGWLYHSHVHSIPDTHAGLMGAIIICRKGACDENLRPLDVEHEFVTLFSVLNENVSPFLDDNIKQYMKNTSEVDKGNLDFIESNMKHTINGYMFGNMQGLKLKEGARTRWYMMALGSEVDMHTPRWEEGTVLDGGYRTDVWGIMPASQKTVDVVVNRPGTFIFQCAVGDHIAKGMQALYVVEPKNSTEAAPLVQPDNGAVWRKYYIGIVEELWDYAPAGYNVFKNASFTDAEKLYVSTDGGRIGSKYKKALYREFTDSTFTKRKAAAPEAGTLGPIIRAAVGDAIEVVLKNMAAYTYNMKVGGSLVADPANPEEVASGEVVTYKWLVSDISGPGPKDLSSKAWIYNSDVSLPGDAYAGLVGPVVITRRGQMQSNGLPADVDRDFAVVFSNADENSSPYIDDNSKRTGANIEDPDFVESNIMTAINGYVFGNMPMDALVMTQGDRVRWHVLAWGGEGDLHSPRWHGQTVVSHNNYVDVLELASGVVRSINMLAHNPGTWKFGCEVVDHEKKGEQVLFTVKPSTAEPPVSVDGAVRVYYIAADEVVWDYAPAGRNVFMNLPFGEQEKVFLEPGKDRIGNKYVKAFYVEYTDETFLVQKQRSAKYQHFGFLGPAIRGVVGDTIKVVFKNKATRPYSMAPHGLFFSKSEEGETYNDQSKNKSGAVVPPGGNHTYIWLIPPSAGPGPNDPTSVVWMYRSAVDPVGDLYAGLVGPIIVTAKGQARDAPEGNLMPIGVDREFVTLFAVSNENMSPYLETNVQQFAFEPKSVDIDDPAFQESNMMHGINGFVYGNLAGLHMNLNEVVRWYILVYGAGVDIHAVHWHGQVLSYNGHRIDVIEMQPSSAKVMDMVADDPGNWMYHCHVNDHINAGMIAIYTITDPNGSPCVDNNAVGPPAGDAPIVIVDVS